MTRPQKTIAIQPTFSKIFEKILLAQINDFLEANKILHEEQYGFRAQISTESLLFKLHDKVTLLS